MSLSRELTISNNINNVSVPSKKLPPHHARLINDVPDCKMGSSILQWSNHAWQYAPGGFTLLAIAVIPLLFLLQRLVFPKFDPREPPVLRPKIPVIGHLISMARERTGLYRRLYRDNSLPICTLPMLNGKLYVINSPNLISSAMRSKDLSFDPFVLEFIVNGVCSPILNY